MNVQGTPQTRTRASGRWTALGFADLFALLLVCWGLVVLVHGSDSGPVRAAAGIPGLLILPGYAVVAALFPASSGLGTLERLGISVPISIVLVTLLGLALALSPWGLSANVLVLVVAGEVTGFGLVAALRRLWSVPAGSSVPIWDAPLRTWNGLRTGQRVGVAAGSLGLLVVIALLGAVLYSVQQIPQGQGFTGFYLLNTNGQANQYETSLKVGQPTQYILGIENHEGRQMTYNVRAVLGANSDRILGPITLKSNQTWQGPILVTPREPIKRAKVEFHLTRGGDSTVYRRVYVWVQVIGKSG